VSVLPSQAGHLGVEILNAARRWALARSRCRRLFDSKSAPKADVEQATQVYNKAADELELAVRRLERVLQLSGIVAPIQRRTAPFPWKPFLGALSEGLRAVEAAVNAKNSAVQGVIIDAEVIETPPKGD
jgi:hypothetical protein